jgi:peptidoglycan/xylan/chitin deacetylase (PgdA/CDA1 family)
VSTLFRAALRAQRTTARLRAELRRADRWTGVRVFGYHRVADDPGDMLAVSPAAFAAQMEAVVESGATPIRLEDALDLLAEPVDGRYAAVTFDDGYRDVAENAEPVLRRLGIPATVFVTSGVPSGEARYFWYDDPPPALGWDEIAELADGGVVDFQSHTCTHPWLPRLSDERARDEIVRSKVELEERLGRPVTTLAYPAGLYGEREEALVREAGYRAGVTTDPGVNRGGSAPLRITRTLVFGDDGEDDFAAKLRGVFDRPSIFRRYFYRRRAAGSEADAYARLS